MKKGTVPIRYFSSPFYLPSLCFLSFIRFSASFFFSFFPISSSNLSVFMSAKGYSISTYVCYGKLHLGVTQAELKQTGTAVDRSYYSSSSSFLYRFGDFVLACCAELLPPFNSPFYPISRFLHLIQTYKK